MEYTTIGKMGKGIFGWYIFSLPIGFVLYKMDQYKNIGTNRKKLWHILILQGLTIPYINTFDIIWAKDARMQPKRICSTPFPPGYGNI
jgi:hypothetical protein